MSNKHEKLSSLFTRRANLLSAMIESATACVAQMKDAGMLAGSDRLNEILFQLSALDQEMVEFMKSNVDVVIEMIVRKKVPPINDDSLND